jgi:hypothetical protein
LVPGGSTLTCGRGGPNSSEETDNVVLYVLNENKNLFFLCVHREALSFSYYPANQGISLKHFPFRGGNYQAPLVAIKVSHSYLTSLINMIIEAVSSVVNPKRFFSNPDQTF